MRLLVLFNFVITISKVRVKSIKIELKVLNPEKLFHFKIPFLCKFREGQTALQEGKMDGTYSTHEVATCTFGCET